VARTVHRRIRRFDAYTRPPSGLGTTPHLGISRGPNATDEHPQHGTGNITVPNQERGGRYGSARFTGELLGQPEWTRNMDLNPRVYFTTDLRDKCSAPAQAITPMAMAA
jgi:hypothetical protein